jgi:NADH-quinone oxidoreductase subunit I
MGNILTKAIGGMHQVWRGLATVFAHTGKEPTTLHYPDKTPLLAPHFRGRLALTVNPESGEHLCISCRQCERVCPDKCIEITAHKSPDTNKLELIDFKIDHGLCMFCGLCTEVCPTQCIINTNDFEMADYTRSSLVYDLKRLTLGQDESAFYFDKKEMPLPKPKPAKAAPAAAGAAAAKPAAAAAAKPAAAGDAAKTDAAKPAAAGDVAKTDAAKPAAAGDAAKTDAAKPAAAGDAAKTDAAKPAAADDAAKPEAAAEPTKSADATNAEAKSAEVKEEKKEGPDEGKSS